MTERRGFQSHGDSKCKAMYASASLEMLCLELNTALGSHPPRKDTVKDILNVFRFIYFPGIPFQSPGSMSRLLKRFLSHSRLVPDALPSLGDFTRSLAVELESSSHWYSFKKIRGEYKCCCATGQ